MESIKVTPSGIKVPRLFYQETKDRDSIRSITERVVIETINNINNSAKIGESKEILKLVIDYLKMNI